MSGVKIAYTLLNICEIYQSRNEIASAIFLNLESERRRHYRVVVAAQAALYR